MAKKKQVTVNLFGAQGSRSTQIQPRGGFPTRHVKSPSKGIPSIFEPIKPNPTQIPVKAEPRQRVTPQDDAQKVVTDDPRKDSLSIDAVFAKSLPLFIEASRWGRYIAPGPASRIHDNTVFIYHNPCSNFWDLYEISKGIFRDLGIRLLKPKGVWEARIPIQVLTDKVFVESGLASVEKTLLAHTGIDPVAVLDGIRRRQFQETQDGIKRCKQSRSAVRETVEDVVGLLAIVALSWATYVMMGVC